MLPYLRPRISYLILEPRETKLAKGSLCLDLQGAGTKEAEAFSPNGGGWFVAPIGWQSLLCQYMLGFLDCCTSGLMIGENACALTLQKQML